MQQESKKGTPDQKIASKAKVWRYREKVAIANKADVDKQKAEYRALQQLRETIDNCGSEP